MRRILNGFLSFLCIYAVGIILGVLFWILRIIGRIRVIHADRIPKWQKTMIIAPNHPSLLEPFILPPLFFREYMLYPNAYTIYETPDTKNFYESWYWFWFRPRTIPVPRGNRIAEGRAMLEMKTVLDRGGRIIIFAEGGRTEKGNHHAVSRTGKKLRELKPGVGWLTLKTEAIILPVWIEGTDTVLPNNGAIFPRFWKNPITIKIGKPLRFLRALTPEKTTVTDQLTESLLELADE